MKLLQRAFRKDLVQMLSQSEDAEASEFAKELERIGQYTEATANEIERFLKIVDAIEAKWSAA